jgi:hypothetical protein
MVNHLLTLSGRNQADYFEYLSRQGGSFVNILRSHFLPISFCQEIVKAKCFKFIFGAKILYENCARKTLMTLTTGVSFVNILCSLYCAKVFCADFL